MSSHPANQSDYAVAIQKWIAHAPWYRRMSAKVGLQAKLVMCFMFLLLITLSCSYWLFLREWRATMWRETSERAVNLAQTLGMAAREPLQTNDERELSKMCRDFVKNDNLVGVSFSAPSGKLVTYACQDLDATPQELGLNSYLNPQSLLQPKRLNSKVLGTVATVTAPVLRVESDSTGTYEGTRLLGYVTISLSDREQVQAMGRVYMLLVLVGCVVVLLTFPAVYVLVYRIFAPIRQLVSATQRIAQGDWDAAVATDRPDLIGTLARSFNQMMGTVKQQREALADANRDLEAKVTQRTAQLEMANKRLSSEIAEKEDFLRAVSHDLNAPLRNISGMATMLLMKSRDKFDDDIIHRLERIQKNVEAETDLIAELLELSRIKTRRQKMEPVNVVELVSDIEAMLEEDLRTRGISLVVDNTLPTVNCEKARLRQVFQNLIDNAIKYMGDGATREIHVGCTAGTTETEFYVRDTGIGIDAEDLGKVFHVFRRGKNTAAANIPGKGVGLASVKSIIETYNGTIWVESELGKGSTFRFTINGKYLTDAPSNGEIENDEEQTEADAPQAAVSVTGL
jgi:signal transduction histidine kinase